MGPVNDRDGHYSLEVPVGNGTTVIREVVPPGTQRTYPALGYHTLNVAPFQVVVGMDFGNAPLPANPGSVSGRVVRDENSNGTPDQSDSGLSGVRVYVDLDSDGVFDQVPGQLEPSAVTLSDGTYVIAGVTPGQWRVRQVVPVGYQQLFPSVPSYLLVTVASGQQTTSVAFANNVAAPGSGAGSGGDEIVGGWSATTNIGDPTATNIDFATAEAGATHPDPISNASGSTVATSTNVTTLYASDFETDASANWTVNKGPATVDEAHNFYFDYSTVGIPAAPNSAGGTHGLKLQANQSSNVFGGMSVSPTGESFTGDYRLEFDWWSNFNGPAPGGGSGSTQLSTFGIGTSGTTPQWPGGVQDSIWFAGTGDGNSASDWRAYSPAASTSYVPASGVYAAGTATSPDARNSSHPYYATFGGISPPAAQAAIYPQQTGATLIGSAAFAWHRVEIEKLGDYVTWTLDGKLVATVPAAQDTVSTGDNIFFGQSDTNTTSSNDVNDTALLFTLIDNVQVVALDQEIHGQKWEDLDADGIHDMGEPGLAGVKIYVDVNGNGVLDLGGLAGDYNDDGRVDAADYVVWRKTLGTAYQLPNEGPGVTPGMVTQEDFNVWRAHYGETAGAGQSAAEPYAITMADDPMTSGIDETGTYWIMDVPTGTFYVREIVPSGFRQTYPNPLSPPAGASARI